MSPSALPVLVWLAVMGQPDPRARERTDGPTRMSAILGNGRLTVGADADGAFNVVRWPSPTHHEHLHHVTRAAEGPDARALPRMGASAADGMVAGVVVDDGSGPRVVRVDAGGPATRSAWASDTSRVATWTVTTPDVEIRQSAWVSMHTDVLRVRVEVVPRRELRALSVFLFAHPAPSARRWAYLPASDVAGDDPGSDDPNGFAAAWDDRTEAAVSVMPFPALRAHAAAAAFAWSADDGVSGGALLDTLEESTAVAVALGCDRPVTFQVGGADDGQGAVLPRDAWADLADGKLASGRAVVGDHTVALLAAVSPHSTSDTSFFLALGDTPSRAGAALAAERSVPAAAAFETVERVTRALADTVVLPATDDGAVRAAALRALIVLDQLRDPVTGAVAASAASQPYLSVDRPLDSAVADRALAHAGLMAAAVAHRTRWAAWQRRDDDAWGPAGTAHGAVYSDGMPASLVGWSLDGLAWSLMADADVAALALATPTSGEPGAGLRAVAESAPRAMGALLACVDVSGQTCPAAEWDDPRARRTTWQLASVVAGLERSRGLAQGLGRPDEAEAADEQLDLARAALRDQLDRDGESVTLPALALALGEAGLPREDAQRDARLEALLIRLEAWLQGSGRAEDGNLVPLVVWQALVATRDKPLLRGRVEAILDDVVRRLPPLGALGLALEAPRGPDAVLDARVGQPAALAHAALYLALLERHGRRSSASLPVPSLPGCGCNTGHDGQALPWMVLLLGLGLARRVTRRPGKFAAPTHGQ